MLLRLGWIVAAVGLGAALLAVPGVLPAVPAVDQPLASGGSGIAMAPADAPTPGPATGTRPAPTAVAPTTEPADPLLTSADRAAGLRSSTVPAVGTGTTVVVPGSGAAPGPGPVRTVRVEVEGGLPVDGDAFADFVLGTLNDPRGWGAGGAQSSGVGSFARTDGDAGTVVILASPETSARLCRPLDTGGTLSCRIGDRVVLTHHRWVLAHPDYGTDRTGYRHYLVNHEIGHTLGRGHVPCPGPGLPAPVMMQQTKGLLGCTPNPWP